MEKVVLITGCGSGIGKAIMLEADRKGFIVYAGLRNAAASLKNGEELTRRGITFVQLDITKADERTTIVERMTRERGRIDVLVNNAGATLGGFLEQVEEDEVRHVFDVNFFGTWGMTNAVLPVMRKQGNGLIINISSTSGIIPFPGFGVYASSKFALEGMSEVLRHEVNRFGIDVTMIEPGAYRTDIFQRNGRMSRGTQKTESVYYSIMKHTEAAFLEATARMAADPADLARFIVGLFDKKKLRMRYPVGPTAKTRAFVRRFFPFSFIERTIGRMFRSRSR